MKQTELIDFEIPIDYFNQSTIHELVKDFIFQNNILAVRKLIVRVEYKKDVKQ